VAKAKKSPFDLTLSDDQQKTVGIWLSFELNNGIAARSAQESEVEYWHAIYEQARTRAGTAPWPDAADLTSWIATEQVDSIHARMMKTVWVEPLCTVSGYGSAADRAPFVEEFHQWWVEEEDLQSVLDKFFLMGLIEPRALVEVSESSQRRPVRKQINAKLQITPDGGLIFDEKGNAQFEKDDHGNHVEAQQGEPSGTVVVDSSDVLRTGPQYRLLPYRDSLILPGHARDEDEIWGYAKRIYPRIVDLKALAAQGVYDKDAVAKLDDTGDRESDAALDRSNQAVAPQQGETAEKELWEVLWLVDLDDFFERHNTEATGKKQHQGARWYLATIHLRTQTLLRLKHDDFEQSRYVPLILLPRTDRATEGYSFIGHKLITVVEEHTAYRNMAADCTAKAVNAPVLRVAGALWDPDEQPMGPKSVIDVRDPREISPMVMPDVPQSVFIQQDRIVGAGQRLGGINDIASGQQTEKGDPTLGEVQMATEQSFRPHGPVRPSGAERAREDHADPPCHLEAGARGTARRRGCAGYGDDRPRRTRRADRSVHAGPQDFRGAARWPVPLQTVRLGRNRGPDPATQQHDGPHASARRLDAGVWPDAGADDSDPASGPRDVPRSVAWLPVGESAGVSGLPESGLDGAGRDDARATGADAGPADDASGNARHAAWDASRTAARPPMGMPPGMPPAPPGVM
jgi:hypothetical protein